MYRFPRFSFFSQVFLLTVVSGFTLWGETIIEPFTLPSARSSAMGGVHAAQTDDFYALFTNPAAFVDVEEEFSAGELTVSTYGPVFEIIDLVRNSSGALDSLDISGIIGERGFAAGFDIGGPLALGWIGRGLGLGLFSRTKSTAAITGTVIRPIVSEDLLLLGGYSFRFLDKDAHILDAGFLGKGFFRGTLNLEASIFDIETLTNEPLNRPFKTALGLGFDLGFRYTFANAFSAALVCYDAYSPALVTTYSSVSDFQEKKTPLEAGTYATVTRRLNLGFKYRINSEFLERYISNFVIMADYRDILDIFSLIPRNPVLNVGIGLELVLLNVFSIRAGIADALPAVGFGLDLTFVKLDCALYGKELGLDPGIQPVYAMDIALLFRY
jgi:hypothetical protein